MDIKKIIKLIARCGKVGITYDATDIVKQLVDKSPTFCKQVEQKEEHYPFHHVEIMDTFEFYYETNFGDTVLGFYDRKFDLSIIFGMMEGHNLPVLLHYGTGFIPKFADEDEEAQYFRNKIEEKVKQLCSQTKS